MGHVPNVRKPHWYYKLANSYYELNVVIVLHLKFVVLINFSALFDENISYSEWISIGFDLFSFSMYSGMMHLLLLYEIQKVYLI